MKDNKATQNDDYNVEKDTLSADCDNNQKRRRKLKLIDKNKKTPRAHIDNASFLALLVRSFVSFSLIIILGVIGVFVVVNWAVGSENSKMSNESILDYEHALVDGEYSSIPIENFAGKDGWLEIADKDGNVVYSTRSESGVYTKGELDWIQKFGANEKIELHELSDGPYYYLIVKTYYDENGDQQEQFLALSSTYGVLSGNIPTTGKTTFTQKEFDFLTYNGTHGKETLTKYSFIGGDGENYYAIILNQNENRNTATYIVAIILACAIIALFVVVMVLYIRYINKHVKKPLAVLSNAMTSFAKDEKRERLDYKGSKEFEHLYDSFNEMVDLLGASESQRIALAEDKQRMLAGLSHDLKTPITIIQGFAKAINDGLVSEEDKQKYLQIILNKSTQMSDLVNQFYEYNKLEHPDFVLDCRPTDIAELARTYLAGIYDEFELRGYNLNAQITEEKLVCDIDTSQFIRVFENLVGNFFKYTPIGSTLSFEVEKGDSDVVIRICDDGPGISDESREDVFEAFVVGEKSRNKQGSGLGLAVSKKIVEMHGGSITLAQEAAEGYNTQFDIVLPLIK